MMFKIEFYSVGFQAGHVYLFRQTKNTMAVNVSSQLQDSVSTEECRMTTSLHRIKVVLGESTLVSLNHVGFKCVKDM